MKKRTIVILILSVLSVSAVIFAFSCNKKDTAGKSIIEFTSVNEAGETVVETSVVAVNNDETTQPSITAANDKAVAQTSDKNASGSANDIINLSED